MPLHSLDHDDGVRAEAASLPRKADSRPADTFDVLEGSPVDLKVRPKLDRYEKLRQELLTSGDLVRDGDGGRLMKTVSFSTPSGAADFVLGGSNNGWIEWKDGDKQTLDALYRK